MSLFEEAPVTNVSPKLDDFVGEGKKYRDAEAVAKALVEKDNFIERLKAEQEALRSELSTRPNVDRSQEILDRLESLNRREPVTERQPEPSVVERTEVKGLSAEDVDRILSDRERRAKAEANIAKVKEVLIEKFGDKYPQALKSMAEKNGLGTKFLDTMAAESPQALLNLMAVEKPETLFTPPNSVVQPGSFIPSSGNPRNEKYYKQLLATDKTKYFSAEVQNQQYKDMMALKEAYYT